MRRFLWTRSLPFRRAIGDYYVDIRGGRFDGSYFGEGMRAGEKGSDRLDQMMERAKKLMDSAAQMKENIGKMEGK